MAFSLFYVRFKFFSFNEWFSMDIRITRIIVVRVIIIVTRLRDFFVKVLLEMLWLRVIYMTIRTSLMTSLIWEIIRIISCIIIAWSFIILISGKISFIRRNIFPIGKVISWILSNHSITTIIVITVPLKRRREVRWIRDLLFLHKAIVNVVRLIINLLWTSCQTRRCLEDLIFGVFILD